MGKKSHRFESRRQGRPGQGTKQDRCDPVLLVCEKCERRLSKEGRFRFIGQMRQALFEIGEEAQASGSSLRILPVSCLDVCPRGAMAVATPAPNGRGPAEIHIVHNPDELEAVCLALTSLSSPAQEQVPLEQAAATIEATGSIAAASSN